MRKIFVGILIVVLFYFGYISFGKNVLISKNKKISKPTFVLPTAGLQRIEKKKSIFVPDWNLNGETIIDNSNNRWIYFGSDEKKVQFVEALKGKELWYTEKVNNVTEDVSRLAMSTERYWELQKDVAEVQRALVMVSTKMRVGGNFKQAASRA